MYTQKFYNYDPYDMWEPLTVFSIDLYLKRNAQKL